MGFELRARIGLDNSPLVAGLEQTKRHIAGFKGSLSNAIAGELSAVKGQMAGLFGVAMITAAARSVVEYAGELDEFAQQWNVNTTEAQEFLYVAQQSGLGVKKVMASLGKEAKEGLLDPKQVEELRKEFQDLGLTIDESVIARFDDLGDSVDRLGLRLKKVFMEQVVEGADSIEGTFSRIRDFLEFAFTDGLGTGERSSDLMQNLFFLDEDDPDYKAALENAERLGRKLRDKLRNRTPEMQGPPVPDGFFDPDKQHDVQISRLTTPRQMIARQFDSLARIGGFMQNTDQMQISIAQQQLQELKGIKAALEGKGLGGEVNYL
jgi:hypothetical protein